MDTTMTGASLGGAFTRARGRNDLLQIMENRRGFEDRSSENARRGDRTSLTYERDLWIRAREFVRAGRFAEAKQEASHIENPFKREDVLAEIAVAEAQRGQFREAAALADQLLGQQTRKRVLVEIAASQAGAGFVAEARSTADRIGNSLFLVDALIKIAVAEAGRDGDPRSSFAEAKRVIGAMELSPFESAEELQRVARAEWSCGFRNDAHITARGIVDEAIRSETLNGFRDPEGGVVVGQ